MNTKATTIIAAFFVVLNVAAQKEENIGSEVVNVVKPYTPAISDAFKVKETPVFKEEQSIAKEKVSYNIYSFPVSSHFMPVKGKPDAVQNPEREKLYNNYATLAAGNYTTLNAELFITENFGKNNYISAMLRHLSSQGGIKNLLLDDNYYKTNLDITYGYRERDLTWNIDFGGKNQINNWYGLPFQNIYFTDAEIADIDERQMYNTLYLGGKIMFDKALFRRGDFQYKRFFDAFGSAENRFFVKPQLGFEVEKFPIDVDLVLDYAGGTFEKNYTAVSSVAYDNFIFGTKPSIRYQSGDWSVNVGAGLFFGSSKLNSVQNNKLYVYPNVKASYKIVGDVVVGYAGAEGGLTQNSYADFVEKNPFVSPSLVVLPTDNKYDFYAGLEGKLSNSVAFNIRASYLDESNKPLFMSNPKVWNSLNDNGYAFANSFQVLYDNVRTLRFFGQLNADFNKVNFVLNATFNNYTTAVQAQAWNLPQLQASATANVELTKKWYAGTTLFYVGKRSDNVSVEDYSLLYRAIKQQEITLPHYLDANAHIGYRITAKLTAFLKGNNLANNYYQFWANYPVQGIQVLLGANYKFDF